MRCACKLGALLVCASAALAQPVISTHAAVVAYRVGTVLVDGQPVQVPYLMQTGQTLRTTDQSAVELLLLPGAFLRLDGNTSLRMEETRLDDTQVAIQEGSGYFEVGQISKDSLLRVHFRGSVIEFNRAGIFHLDARKGRLRVYSGEAAVERGNKFVAAKPGKTVDLAGDLTVSRFDPRELQSTFSWAAQQTWRRMARLRAGDQQLGYGPIMALVALPPDTSIDDLVFRGYLEKIARESISIRLSSGIIMDARLPDRGDLAANRLSEGRHVGDPVEIACKLIPPVYDAEARLYRYMELTGFRSPLLLPPKRKDLSDALESRVWREPGNLVRPPGDASIQRWFRSPDRPPPANRLATAAQEFLEHARTANFQYASKLADIVADEIVLRYRRGMGEHQWQYVDAIESEVRASDEGRMRVVRDGMLWNQPFEAIPGFRWYGSLEPELAPFATSLDSAACTTAFKLERRQTVQRKQVSVYEYSAPPDDCMHGFDAGYQRFFPAFKGRVFLEESTGRMMRFEEKALGFPAIFGFAQAEREVILDDVKIGDAVYLLPVSAAFQARFSQGDEWSVKVEYKNHRLIGTRP